MSTIRCSDCSAVYADHLEKCPRCGCPNPQRALATTTLTHCPSCGAPLVDSVACDYCGTLIPQSKPQNLNAHGNSSGSGNTDGSSAAIGAAAAAFIGGFLGGLVDD